MTNRDVTQERVGVIGLGTMGRPMAMNLLASGRRVFIYHRDPARMQTLASAGGVPATSIADLAKACDIIVLMLPDDNAVKDVIHGGDHAGIASVVREDQVVVDCSTVHPETSRSCSLALAGRGAHHLDAPVTGSRPQAEAGELCFLVGGHKPVYERCIDLFQVMGKRHTYLGDSGAGASTKLASNFMVAAHLLALSEALAIVTRAGIAPKTFLDIISKGGARSAIAEAKGPKILRQDWTADFAIRLMLKDLNLVRDLSEEPTAKPLRLIDCVAQHYRDAVEWWGGDVDVCAITRDRKGTPS